MCISLLQFQTTKLPRKSRTQISVPPETMNVPPLPGYYCTVSDVVCSIDVTSVPKVNIPDNLTSVIGQEMNGYITLWICYLPKNLIRIRMSHRRFIMHLVNERQEIIQLSAPYYPFLLRRTWHVHYRARHKAELHASSNDSSRSCKNMQWTWSDGFGAESFIVMFGGLYLEMTLWNVLVDLLDNSG